MTAWLTISEMVADVGGKVSADQVRHWCATGLIVGAVNKGSDKRKFWIAPATSWEEFKTTRQAQKREPRSRVQVIRDRSGKNLLGV